MYVCRYGIAFAIAAADVAVVVAVVDAAPALVIHVRNTMFGLNCHEVQHIEYFRNSYFVFRILYFVFAVLSFSLIFGHVKLLAILLGFLFLFVQI